MKLIKYCKSCSEKQKIIDILHDTCASYESRIKRFQTLSRKRKNEKRRVVKIPLKSDLEWESSKIAIPTKQWENYN